ncbi:hypothetical protein [Paenarthrobacter aromaticivorans]|uniref:HTH tetR-type domain-containing protein n=1 Tax=Paenarthrobacter aromaticivorans TaxID=2849150 RepID=A0ABS6I7S9_9MICC|nr:hypothetical protein [Paenarthrobacter sp. MMS21-TAE1-1]MBU8867781.1 hypothetical protein [Paenarthrobacter sp. MMS21-TAE1-1]
MRLASYKPLAGNDGALTTPRDIRTFGGTPSVPRPHMAATNNNPIRGRGKADMEMSQFDVAGLGPGNYPDFRAAASPMLTASSEMRLYLEKFNWSCLSDEGCQLLETFVSEACTKSYRSLSVRSLAHQLGVRPSILLRRFPGGVDEIATEAFRWHFYKFASAVLQAIEHAADAETYWRSLVRVHLERQLAAPEHDLWDVLIAADRVAGFLPPQMLVEYFEGYGLYERMYAAAAFELGYRFDDVGKFVKVVVKVLSAAGEWCTWNGKQDAMNSCVTQGVAITRALMSVDLGLNSR